MKESIRVLLAEDHHLVRAGIKALLQNLAGIRVVAETGDGREALELIDTHSPDVVLMDIGMPGMNGLEVTARATKNFPNIRIIILSMHANEEYVAQALRAGAAGYLLKDAGTSELEIAIRAIVRGETYLSPKISKLVVSDFLSRADTEAPLLQQLSPRQREILQCIAEGKTTKEIAFLLKVSGKTVETHRAQLMDRLGIYDVAGLVRYAIRAGLVSSNE